MFEKTFIFQNGVVELYDVQKGYGFIEEANIPGATMSEKSLYAGGWNMRPGTEDPIKAAVADKAGVAIESPRAVLRFKANVPEEGAYRVTVRIEGPAKNVALFGNRRNYVCRKIDIAAGEVFEKTYIQYVAPYIPAMDSVRNTERAVYVSVVGAPARLTSVKIETAKAPTVWIAGDSTLTDQNTMFPYYPTSGCGGWGQAVLSYFEDVAVCNQAHSGMTSNCFRDDGHWDIVTERIQPGDVFMFQFGHNDQKRRNLAAFGGYLHNLRWYVSQVRAKGAIPVIVSPITRVPSLNAKGEKFDLLTDHSAACKQAARDTDAYFIDLHSITFDFQCSMEEAEGRKYYNGGDATHTSDYGAARYAAFVVEEAKKLGIEPFVSKAIDVPLWDTADDQEKPEPPKFGPGGPARGMFQIKPPYIDIAGIKQYDDICKAMSKGLLDPCVMHLHPTEEMPRGQFLFVFFKALRMSGKQPYSGKFCDVGAYEWDSSYVQACLEAGFIDEATTPNDRFRPDDGLTGEELCSFMVRALAEEGKRNISLADCVDYAVKNGLTWEGFDPKAMACRADCYASLVKLMDLAASADKELPADTEIHPVG